ncbi:Actin binding protein [Entamoeba marina]
MSEPTNDDNQNPQFNIESESDVDPFLLKIKEFLEKHDLDISIKLKPKKMRGFTSTAEGDGLKTGEVNIPGDFKIQGHDNTGKELDHGGDDVVAKVLDPEGNEVPCEVKDNGDGTYDVQYVPVVPGMHEVQLKVNDEDLKDSPIKVLVFDETPDATQCTAEGEAPIKIVARNRLGEQLKKGGQKFDVTVNGPTTPAEVTLTDNEDGTYDVQYVAKEPGNHHIDIQVEVPVLKDDGVMDENQKEMKSIKDMPKDVNVALNSEDADPTQCYAEGPGVEGGCKTSEMAEFIIHAIKSNGEPCTLPEVPFDVCVTDPDDDEIEAKLERKDDGTYHAEYKPTKPGTYNVEVNLRNPEIPTNFEPIKNSPYSPEILPGISGPNCIVTGPGVDGGEELDDCNDAEFTIQAKDYNGDEIKEGGETFVFNVVDPNGDVLPCECNDNGDGTYSCKYAPEFPGSYSVGIELNGDKVGKAPYEVIVGEGVDNNKSEQKRWSH